MELDGVETWPCDVVTWGEDCGAEETWGGDSCAGVTWGVVTDGGVTRGGD